jgi:hypothetical protein
MAESDPQWDVEMAKRKTRTVLRAARKKRGARQNRVAPRRRRVAGSSAAQKIRSAKKRRSPAGRPGAKKKRAATMPKVRKKEREVDEARVRLMRAQVALAAEELPDRTKKS